MRFLSDTSNNCSGVFDFNVGFSHTLASSTGADLQDFYDQIPIILRELIYRLNDEDPDVLKATNKAFASLSKSVPAEELVKHVEFMCNLISSMVSEARRRKGGVGDGEFFLPGFNMPKGKQFSWMDDDSIKMKTQADTIPDLYVRAYRD